MSKKFIILFLFWWSLIFPGLSFNSFTTDIISNDIKYSDLNNKVLRENILQNAEYTFWFSTNHK